MNHNFDVAMDYFALLGVPFDADADQIKKGYRKMAMRYHPDLSKLVDAHERFQTIAEAYEILNRYREAYVRARKVHITTQKWQQKREAYQTHNPSEAKGTYSQTTAQPYQSTQKSSNRTHSDEQVFHQRLSPSKGRNRELTFPITLRYAVRLLQAGYFLIPGLNIKMRFTRDMLDAKWFRLRAKGFRGRFGGEPGDLLIRFDVKTQTERFELDEGDIVARYKVPPILLTEGHLLNLDSPAGRFEWKVCTDKLGQQPIVIKGLGLPSEKNYMAGDLKVFIHSY